MAALVLIALPIYKALRKSEGHQRVSDRTLSKFINIASVFYFLMIQESLTLVLLSLLSTESNSGLDIILGIVYFVSLVLYIVNQYHYPLSIFRSKPAQFWMLVSRLVGPFFLMLPRDRQFLFFPGLFIPVLFEIIYTNENKDRGKTNRLFFYKFFYLLAFALAFLYSLL